MIAGAHAEANAEEACLPGVGEQIRVARHAGQPLHHVKVADPGGHGQIAATRERGAHARVDRSFRVADESRIELDEGVGQTPEVRG